MTAVDLSAEYNAGGFHFGGGDRPDTPDQNFPSLKVRILGLELNAGIVWAIAIFPFGEIRIIDTRYLRVLPE